jgi:DNA-binding CsgD family transcriptional regulator
MTAPPARAGSAAKSVTAQLVGRRSEREALDRLLETARQGHGGVLVVHGDPGLGKTALLEYAVETARSFRVARAVGVEGEMELAYAALQQLASPSLELRERLPDPQRQALAVAFGLSAGDPPNAYLVGLAVLGLLTEAAEQQPLLCLVDDAQWLDRESAQALAFVARRLMAERIALIFATRNVGESLARLAELHVGPLGYRDARTLLEGVLPGPLDEQVIERLVAEAHGNPLALLELPRGMTPTQLAGGFGLPDALPLSDQLMNSFTRRLDTLPADARLLLLVAAADPTGDLALVWRAARRLGIPDAAAQAAEAEGLLAFGARVTFRHPLVRSAVYRSAAPDCRSEVHLALAEATDLQTDPDRRAWHRGQAASAPDEEIADELERSADRARARGGVAAAAAFLERSSILTLDPARRASRALAAARATQQAGALDEAQRLLGSAEAGPLDALERAQVDVIRAQIVAVHRGSDAPALLLAAAKRLEVLDIGLARQIHLDALTSALFAGRLGGACDARYVALSARAAPPSPGPSRGTDLLLDGLAALITEGSSAGTPILRKAIKTFAGDRIGSEEGLRWLWLAGRAAAFIWDYDSWDSLTRRQIRLARDLGALAHLPLALSTHIGVQLFAGEMRAAASLVAESDTLADITSGWSVPPYGPLVLAAFRGSDEETTRLLRASVADFHVRGEGMGLTVSQWVTAVLNNGRARYEEAYAAASEATADPHELFFSTFATVELIEAASRTGRGERAVEALEVLSESTQASGTPWALGVEARSRALVTPDDAAEPLYLEAIALLKPTRLRFDLARAHLLYGEWLRRARRRLDARAELRLAYELFSGFGMEAFAERARVELLATGERARRRTVDASDQLTPQETQISVLAGKGHTNREIAAQLFISPSTVEYHLRKAFRKLDVTSRTQLANRPLGQ